MAYEQHQVAVLLDEDLLDIAENTAIFAVDGTNVLSPAAWADGAWRYIDLPDLLNGRCVDYDLEDQIQDSTGRALTVTLNSAGHVVLTGGFAAGSFEVRPSADNAAWGFDTAGQSASFTGSVWQLVAANQWQRGTRTEHITIRWASDGLDHTVPNWDAYEVQDIPTLLRKASTDDGSARRAYSIEALMGDALDPDPASGTTAWGMCWAYIGDDGRVVLAWHADVEGAVFAWDDDGLPLAYRLGFDGTETPVAGGDDVVRLTATHRPSSVLWPEYAGPLRPVVRDLGEATAGRLGDVAGVDHGTSLGYRLTCWIRGPQAETTDTERESHQVDHHLHEWLQRAVRGRRATIVQRWGDTRRWLRPRLARGTQAAEDLRFTTADREGRIVCRIAEAQAVETTEEYLDDTVDSYMQVDLVLAHIPTEPGPRSAT